MLREVKDYLKITWDDEDISLTGVIERGKASIDDLVGAELDYVNQSPQKALLLDYCRYSYNNATEYFEDNYSKEILRLQLNVGISKLPPEAI